MPIRMRVQRLVEAPGFQHTIMTIIIVNAALLGVATIPELSDQTRSTLAALDRTALAIFVVELLLKLYAYRGRFFRDPWNVFDLLVIGVALVPSAGAFSALRTLRLLRMLRLISVVPAMRRVVATLLAAMPGAAAIVGLLALIVYVSGVLGTTLFGPRVPQHFGDLNTSLWTLFQTLTGEAWPDVADDVMAQYPYAWIFFLIFILVSTFVVLNLFLAVIVSAMESVKDAEEADMEAALQDTEADIRAELAALRREIAALRGLLEPAEATAGAGEAASAGAGSRPVTGSGRGDRGGVSRRA
ncbi:MAG TPA: ion transporter [Natronosporangium sp.]